VRDALRALGTAWWDAGMALGLMWDCAYGCVEYCAMGRI